MDLERTYNNARLEARRKSLLNAQHLAAVLRNNKRSKRSAVDDVNDALASPPETKTPRARAIAQAVKSRGCKWRPADRTALADLLRTVAETASLLDVDKDLALRLRVLVAMAAERAHWARQPQDWQCRTHNTARQLSQLTRHLFAVYDVPAWLDQTWFDAPQAFRGRGRAAWFIFIGQGGNLRKAHGLPVALTKMMAHHAMHAPAGVTVEQALRYGQAVAVGVPPAALHAVLGSRLGRAFGTADEEAFWLTVLAYIARHPMIDPQQIGPVCDYLYAQKFGAAEPVYVNGVFVRPAGPPQPGLSMTHRDPAVLVAQVQQWHRRLARVPTGRSHYAKLAWPTSNIAGLDRIEGVPGSQRRFVIGELLDGAALQQEGAAMRHCVATYAWSCVQGRTAIFSARVDEGGGLDRLLTIEVDLRSTTVVQARGRCNAAATAVGERLVRAWATRAGLKVGPYAFTRGW